MEEIRRNARVSIELSAPSEMRRPGEIRLPGNARLRQPQQRAKTYTRIEKPEEDSTIEKINAEESPVAKIPTE